MLQPTSSARKRKLASKSAQRPSAPGTHGTAARCNQARSRSIIALHSLLTGLDEHACMAPTVADFRIMCRSARRYRGVPIAGHSPVFAAKQHPSSTFAGRLSSHIQMRHADQNVTKAVQCCRSTPNCWLAWAGGQCLLATTPWRSPVQQPRKGEVCICTCLPSAEPA